MRIALIGKTVECRASWIGHADHSSDLVKGFSDRIITRLSDHGKIRIVGNVVEGGMSARDHQGGKWGLQVSMLQISGGNVGFDVIDGNQGNMIGIRQGFSKIYANQKRTDQSRVGCDRDRAYVRQRNARNLQRLISDARDGFDMGTAGNFGYDASLKTMSLNL